MLEALGLSKNVQRVLLFLFVNGKCYGTQLHRALKTPLTPIQKSLNRLERDGLVLSYYEGKTRLYQFNRAYPLFGEVEQLLKKAYTLLSAEEKKGYYHFRADPSISSAASLQILLAFWERLSSVTSVIFHARSKSGEEISWDGKGKGDVVLSKPEPNRLVFTEKGSWQGKQGGDVSFSNVFRWTIDRRAGVISLEHLRRGPDHPVFLFHLAPSSKQTLSSVDSHLCEGDTYFGQIHFDRFGLRLNWRVIGPKKNEEINFHYVSVHSS